MTANEVADELGLTPGRIRQLCQSGRIRGAEKFGNAWAIRSPVKLVERVPTGFVTPTDAAEELGLTPGRVLQLCEAGSIVGAEKVGHRWRIPYPIKRIPRRSGRRENYVEAPVPSIDSGHDAEMEADRLYVDQLVEDASVGG